MSASSNPRFRALDGEEIEAVLARNHIGRMAYSFHDHIDIAPVHYIYERGWIYGRTSPGEKLVTLEHHRWVAFEVDEVAGPFDWRSVVVYGAFYELTPEDAAWAHTLQLIRVLVPNALAEGDPAPHRTVLFRIDVQERSGREASSGAPQEESKPSRSASFT